MALLASTSLQKQAKLQSHCRKLKRSERLLSGSKDSEHQRCLRVRWMIIQGEVVLPQSWWMRAEGHQLLIDKCHEGSDEDAGVTEWYGRLLERITSLSRALQYAFTTLYKLEL